MPLPTSIVVALALAARAGAPMPAPVCQGTVVTTCVHGNVVDDCCTSASCPTPPEIVLCGYGRCVDGRDAGMCIPLETHASTATTAAACAAEYGSWQKACVAGRIGDACIPSMPTNYTGPPQNVPYLTCDAPGRCAPQAEPERCFDTRESAATCAGEWRQTCVQGRLTERCIPAGATVQPRAYVSCGGDRCAIGADPQACR